MSADNKGISGEDQHYLVSFSYIFQADEFFLLLLFILNLTKMVSMGLLFKF